MKRIAVLYTPSFSVETVHVKTVSSHSPQSGQFFAVTNRKAFKQTDTRVLSL